MPVGRLFCFCKSTGDYGHDRYKSGALKGTSLLEDPVALGVAVETAFFKHIFARYYSRSVGFSYWRGKNDREVDIVAEAEGRLIPFEVKYRSQHTCASELKGLAEFCEARKAPRGYVITREIQDFSILSLGKEVETKNGSVPIRIAKIPAPLACYWLGKTELDELPGE